MLCWLFSIYELNVTSIEPTSFHLSCFHEKKPKLFPCYNDYRVFNVTRIEIEHVQLVKAINKGLLKSKRLYNHNFMTTYFSENGKNQWNGK